MNEATAVKEHPSFCRLCQAFCGIVVRTSGDRVVNVSGDPDHPISKGYSCSKGRAGAEMHHHASRLDEPLVRNDTGELTSRSWDDALEHIATTLQRVIADHGPHAIGAYRASGWGFDTAGQAVSDSFLRTLGTGQLYSALTIDCPGKVVVPELMAGATMPWHTPDLDRTQCLVLFGQNPIISHGHSNVVANPIVALRALRARGGRLVVVDPRLTETAQMADVHVRLKPGSDPALLAFMVREVLRRRPDQEFIEAAAELSSLTALERAVAPYTRERTADLCDVAIETLDAALEAILSTPRLAIATGTGTTMNLSANLTEWLVWSLLTLTGSLDRAGGTIFNPGLIRPLDRSPLPKWVDNGNRAAARPEFRPIYGGIPCSALADQIIEGHVRVLFVLGGNPLTQFPDTTKIARAFSQLEMLVVCDVRDTETTALADVVLPCAGQFERHDLNAAYFLAQPFAQYAAAIFEPAANRRRMTWIFGELSRRMDIPVMGGAIDPSKPGGVTDLDALAVVAGSARVSWNEVQQHPHGFIAGDHPEPGWLIPTLLPQRLDLAPPALVDQFSSWEAHLPADGELVCITRRLARQTNSTLRDVGAQAALGTGPTLQMHPADAQDRGIVDGATVVITNPNGRCEASVELTDALRRGAVSLPHGWDPTNVNRLTSDTDDVDPLSGMPRYSGIPVTVAPLVPA